MTPTATADVEESAWRFDPSWLLSRPRDFPNDALSEAELLLWFGACVLLGFAARAQGSAEPTVHDIYQAATRKQAIEEFRFWKSRWIKQSPEAVRCLETDLEALLEFFDCPVALRKKLRTTNAIERLFVEVRRRIRGKHRRRARFGHR